MSYMRQNTLPASYKSRNDIHYTAIGITDGGCTLSVFKEGHLYLFPTFSPSIASCILTIPSKKHELDREKQASICTNSENCYLIRDVDISDSSSESDGPSNKKTSDERTIDHSKFLFSNQFHLLAGPYTFCLFSLEKPEGECLLNINLFELYNKASRCCNYGLTETSTDILISLDVICYRHSVDYLDGKYHVLDLITSYRHLKPVFIRIYFNESHYFIDCKCSLDFNRYLLSLYKELLRQESELVENELFTPIFLDKNDPRAMELVNNTSQICSYPSSTCISFRNRLDRLLNQAMTFPRVNINDGKEINFGNFTHEFDFDFAVNVVVPLSPKLCCVITLSYYCIGLFEYEDEFVLSYRSAKAPEVKCAHAEFLLMPWKSHMPRSICSHPHIEMFSLLFLDRFFILTNTDWYELPDDKHIDMASTNKLWPKNWYIKYHFMDPVVRHYSSYGTFTGEPCHNYFICNWNTNFLDSLSVYDINVNEGINASRLVLNTTKFRGITQFVWVPNFRIIVGIAGGAGELIFIYPKSVASWAQTIPDFKLIQHNIEYIENEDDFERMNYTETECEIEDIPQELWNEPWEPVAYKLGLTNYSFYNINHILSRLINKSTNIYVDNNERLAETLND